MMHMAEFVLFSVMCIITFEVVSRYLFMRPTLWVVDVSRYCLVYITFLAAASLLLSGGHINVDLVLTRLSQKGARILKIITNILGAITFLVFSILSAATTWEQYKRGVPVIDPIEIPMAIPLAIIPIGSFFLFVGSIIQIRNLINEGKTPRVKGGGS